MCIASVHCYLRFGGREVRVLRTDRFDIKKTDQHAWTSSKGEVPSALIPGKMNFDPWNQYSAAFLRESNAELREYMQAMECFLGGHSNGDNEHVVLKISPTQMALAYPNLPTVVTVNTDYDQSGEMIYPWALAISEKPQPTNIADGNLKVSCILAPDGGEHFFFLLSVFLYAKLYKWGIVL